MFTRKVLNRLDKSKTDTELPDKSRQGTKINIKKKGDACIRRNIKRRETQKGKFRQTAEKKKKTSENVYTMNTAKMAPHPNTTSHLLTNPNYKTTLKDIPHTHYK